MAEARLTDQLPRFPFRIDTVQWEFTADFNDDFNSDPVPLPPADPETT